MSRLAPACTLAGMSTRAVAPPLAAERGYETLA
jgi:hypothetical protein